MKIEALKRRVYLGLLQKAALWPCGFMALWPYIRKFGNWPVGAHVIRFAIGVDKQKPCMLLRASSMAYSAQYGVKEPTLCSQIATKEGLEYLSLLQVPFI